MDAISQLIKDYLARAEWAYEGNLIYEDSLIEARELANAASAQLAELKDRQETYLYLISKPPFNADGA